MRISIILEALTGRFETDMQRASRSAQRRSREIEQSFQRMARLATRAFAALGLTISVREFVQLADRARNLENQLKLVTSSTAELARVQEDLFGIAQRTRASFEGAVQLYARMARATSELGISQQRLLNVTEAINRALTISSVPAAAAEAALFQLSQGLAAGALRGDELNSVMEQTPRLAQAIAAGLGVTIGQLRELGKQGKITAEAVIGALEGQADAIRQEFEQMEPTVGQGLTRLGNSLLQFVGNLDEATGASSFFARALEAISSGIDSVNESMAQARDPLQGASSLPELRARLDALRELERIQSRPGNRVGVAGDLERQIAAVEEAIQRAGTAYQKFLSDTVQQSRDALRLDIDLTPSEDDIKFLDNFVAELEIRRRKIQEEIEKQRREMAEEDRLFLDNFVAELNARGSELSQGQRLSPELSLFIDQLREAERLTLQMRTEAERNADVWRDAQALFEGGFISEETLTRVRDSLTEMSTGLSELGVSLGRGMRDWFVDAMSGIEVRWDEMLRRMLANAAFDQLANFLGSFGGPAGRAFNFLGFGTSTPPTRHSGGPVMAGRMYRVKPDEEAFFPTMSGNVVPVSQLGGGRTNVVINNAPPGTDVETRQRGPGIEEIIINIGGQALASGRWDPIMRGRFGVPPTTGMR